MKKKTCFVISPIGAKDSEVRKLADDLFDLIIEPALEVFDFEIIRADKITTASSITTDIIHHVQNSDLCIVDLTGRNPNVMYECGRRHETGKPFIMVAKEGEELPFDVNTIRTFFYNMNDGRSIRTISKTIQQVVSELMKEGFAPSSSGESLSTISDTLRRIERKIDDMKIETGKEILINTTDTKLTDGLSEIIDNLGIYDGYFYLIKTGQLELAAEIFPKFIENINDPENILIYCIPVCDSSEVAAKIVEKELPNLDFENTDIPWLIAFESLVFFWANNRENKLDSALNLKDLLINHAKNNEEKASILNAVSRLCYSLELYQESLQYSEEVIVLWENATYYYNIAMVCKTDTVNDLEKAENAINKMMKFGTTDGDHLELAVKIYNLRGKIELAKDALIQLKAVNKFKAELLSLDW